MKNENVLHEVEFDPQLIQYIFVTGMLICIATIIGIAFLPIWFLGFGHWFARETLRRLECRLTDKTLHLKKGIFFRKEKNIPLDKIQDLGIHQGPLMRYFGIHLVKVETAGQSVAATASEGSLIGVVNAKAFRDLVLEQRDRVVSKDEVGVQTQPTSANELLVEIRDTLLRIENNSKNM